MDVQGKITSVIYDWSATRFAEGKCNINLDQYLSYQWHRQSLELLAHNIQIVQIWSWSLQDLVVHECGKLHLQKPEELHPFDGPMLRSIFLPSLHSRSK